MQRKLLENGLRFSGGKIPPPQVFDHPVTAGKYVMAF